MLTGTPRVTPYTILLTSTAMGSFNRIIFDPVPFPSPFEMLLKNFVHFNPSVLLFRYLGCFSPNFYKTPSYSWYLSRSYRYFFSARFLSILSISISYCWARFRPTNFSISCSKNLHFPLQISNYLAKSLFF